VAPGFKNGTDGNIQVAIETAGNPDCHVILRGGSTFTVCVVESDDILDPGDARIQALLAAVAENTDDPERRDRLLD
jgi:hypothetical protein